MPFRAKTVQWTVFSKQAGEAMLPTPARAVLERSDKSSKGFLNQVISQSIVESQDKVVSLKSKVVSKNIANDNLERLLIKKEER